MTSDADDADGVDGCDAATVADCVDVKFALVVADDSVCIAAGAGHTGA